MKHINPILPEMRTGKRLEAGGKLRIGTGRIYKQYVEPEETKD
jgi:hypothetical protein